MKQREIPDDDVLSLRINLDSDGTAEVVVQVRSNGFAGTGSAWFKPKQIATFGHLLRDTYPLDADGRYSLEGGYWGADNVLEQIHLSLRFFPIDRLGTVGAHINLADPISKSRPNQRASTVDLEFKTTYEDLRRFGGTVSSMVNDPSLEAVLPIEPR